MQKIHLKKIEHRGEIRIATIFEKNFELIAKIKTIPERRWSQTKNCWHVPYSRAAFDALIEVFGKEMLTWPKVASNSVQEDTQPNTPTPKKNTHQPEFAEYFLGKEVKKKVVGDKVIAELISEKSFGIYISYEKKGWVDVIREIPGRKWDARKTCWVLPNVKQSYRILKKHIGMKNLVFNFTIDPNIPEVRKGAKSQTKKKYKPSPFLTEEQQKAIKATEEELMLKQYSRWTLKSYINHLTALFVFFKTLKPEAVGADEVKKYLLHEIRNKKISASTQNQIINAYKAYAEKVLKRPKEFIEIPRPKKPKQLPNVLSEKEVVDLLQSPKNIKHKLALMLLYSAGVRKSELLNLRVEDVNVERRSIFIKGGKGKKDRYVVLAESVLPYLSRYLVVYTPQHWLFEGQTGGKYSGASLQKVFRRAVEQSKVNPFATIHTLRHSYATHCVENGHNLKMVQEALGHGSLKTTEIYLHISSNALKKLKSPLDNLDI